MRILIVEDEKPTAEDIRLLVERILKKRIHSIHIEIAWPKALEYLNEQMIDLLLLDLNLNGRDELEILKKVSSMPFHTIAISATIDMATVSIEYGLLDFIMKPYSVERLKKAFGLLTPGDSLKSHGIKYFSVKSKDDLKIISIKDVEYFKSVDSSVELHLKNGVVINYNKSIDKLNLLLSSRYARIHKLYIIDTTSIERIEITNGNRIILKSGLSLPVSPRRISSIKQILKFQQKELGEKSCR
jgi:DNA-binding LytR/AlgR family response regulator